MRTNLILIAFALAALGANAQHISEQEAMERALQYMNSGKTSIRMAAPVRGGSAELNLTPVGAESIYAFNLKGGGFIIASADSRTLPVLGYSDRGSIDWECMPDNMREWLMQYDDAIATLGDRMDFKDGNRINNGTPSHTGIRTDKAPVEPLIRTRWDQNRSPYNNLIPLYAGINPEWQGQRCMVGCVAVALAQVLNYWQWPKTLPDGLPGYESKEYFYNSEQTWHIDSLPPVTFDWENMLEEYSSYNYSTNRFDVSGNEAEQYAIATLMRYCAQVTKSGYSPEGTGSDYLLAVEALHKQLCFPAAIFLPSRDPFSIDEWEEIVYNELNEGRPVLYGGVSPYDDCGHAFICDGYDGKGLFHINWGMQGNHDGYYSLSVLNPDASTNPNKGSKCLGYTQGQHIIIGLDPFLKELKNPLSDKPDLWLYKNLTVQSGNAVKFYFYYNYFGDVLQFSSDYALGTIATDGTLTPCFIGIPNSSINNNALIVDRNAMTVVIDSTAFKPGETLRLHPMLRFRNSPEAEWKLIPPDSIYIDAGRTEDGRFFIIHEPLRLEYVNAVISSGLGRIGDISDLTVILKNHYYQDFVADIIILPYYYGHINIEDLSYDTPYALGDSLKSQAYIRAGQEGEATFLFNPEQGGLVLFEINTADEEYIGSFFMEFDSIYSYDSYLVNNSYVTYDGNHYVYHVEMCDRPGVTVPDGVPSDSIKLYACIASEDGMFINEIILRHEIKDYLRALPDSAGSGTYKFSTEVSLDIEQDGGYFVESYLIEIIYDEQFDYIYGADHFEEFTVITDSTVIPSVTDQVTQNHSPLYDLQGRHLDGIPNQKGIYMIKGNKMFIK